MTNIRDLHAGWIKDPAYRGEYDALETEFALTTALIRARADAGLTQEELTVRMVTKQEVVARWEGDAFDPNARAAGEGGWHEASNQLRAVACCCEMSGPRRRVERRLCPT